MFVLNLIEDIPVRLAASFEKWPLCEGTIQLLTTSTYIRLLHAVPLAVLAYASEAK